MRRVDDAADFEEAFNAASREAAAAFGRGDCYIEKFILNPKHVEFQVLCDHHDQALHLFERDCSVQRRHQKVVEETPCPVLRPEVREEMGRIAVRAARAVSYVNAGTVEFLLDTDQNFYFLEMNTRLQVEHPVTEMVTGLDLVKYQIRIAAGEEIEFDQEGVRFCGHAVECRINAEDPLREFVPTPGRVTSLHLPGGPGVRVDTHMYSGYDVPSHYDSLLAKVIAHGCHREEAISRMERALAEFIVVGIQTTLPFHRQVMADPAFRQGRIDTGYIETLTLSP